MIRIAIGCLALAFSSASLAAQGEPGVMLRAGNWDGDIGTYEVPEPFAKLKPAQWPNDGWYRVAINGDRAEVSAVAGAARQRPKFLQTIAAQVAAAQASNSNAAALPEAAQAGAENVFYARIPGAPLRTGPTALYRFKNGTPELVPLLDHRYELSLGDMRIAFTVRNGRKARQGVGVARGPSDGAEYTLEYGGNTYVYLLQEYGWDSKLKAVGDLDGDGKPDFLIAVAGNNSAYEYLLLSSLARPGSNPPSAALRATGC